MRIFITGATGFLGGTLATRLSATHNVRGLVRSTADAASLAVAGIEPVLGNLDEAGLLAGEARAADAVINAADSDHAGAVDAILDALDGSGKPFLHTSGSSIVGSASGGEPQDDVYSEDDVYGDATWAPASDKQARVSIDRRVLAAKARDIRSVVLCNSMVYGTGEGVRADSVQIPAGSDRSTNRRGAAHRTRPEPVVQRIPRRCLQSLPACVGQGARRFLLLRGER